jgi:hypothetical protein
MSERWSTEPVDILLHAAVDRLREAGRPLREHGWDAEIVVQAADPWDDHFFDVNLRIRIAAPGRIPIEARP